MAGVYFEAVLKGGQVDLWVRNVHLSVVSFLIGVVGFAFSRSVDPPTSSTNFADGFFYSLTK